jgi:hypothetical protein
VAENETQILRCAALIGRKSKVQGSLNDEDGCVAFFLFVAYKQCGCSKVQANPTNLFNLFIEIRDHLLKVSSNVANVICVDTE